VCTPIHVHVRQAWMQGWPHSLTAAVGAYARAAKYIFQYPAGWKSETINKTDKGTQGVDCRVS
jgi:hypothetical protein